jgi:hypothetical protein
MLTVYTHPISKPDGAFDLSVVPLDEMCDVATNIYEHQKSAVVWLGYLDGWMLTPREEVVLRGIIRAFSCVAVSHYPVSLPYAWKNEIDTIYSSPLTRNGDS